MLHEFLRPDWDTIPVVLVSSFLVYTAIIVYTRIVGLRSLSKMSAADFAMTVAVGSLFASTASLAAPSLLVGLIAALYSGQWLIASARRRSRFVSKLVDNEPLLLMSGQRILDHNLKKANVTRSDLFGKLREANALNYDQVRAVVFETTGDISVLHSTDADVRLGSDFFASVIDAELLFEGETTTGN